MVNFFLFFKFLKLLLYILTKIGYNMYLVNYEINYFLERNFLYASI